MTVTCMDNVGFVVEDSDAPSSSSPSLASSLEKRAPIEGD